MTIKTTSIVDKAVTEVATQTMPSQEEVTVTCSASDGNSEPLSGVMQPKSYVTDNNQLQQLYDESLFRQISNVEHIKATTDELNNLKDTIRDKKKLKEKRNIQTAKLSRDRKKLEVEFMREIGIAYVTCLNKVRNQFSKLATSSHGQKRAFAREALSFI